jgi:hypothetical protein
VLVNAQDSQVFEGTRLFLYGSFCAQFMAKTVFDLSEGDDRSWCAECGWQYLAVVKKYSHKGQIILYGKNLYDRLCSLVVRVSGYRSRDPDSIPSATRFSE